MDTLNETTDLAMWSLLIGFFLPNAMAFIQQPGWSDKTRSVVAFLVCVVAGGITAYLQDDKHFEGKTVTTSVLLVLVTALSTYRNFWKPTGVAPAIEAATSPSPSGE